MGENQKENSKDEEGKQTERKNHKLSSSLLNFDSPELLLDRDWEEPSATLIELKAMALKVTRGSLNP
jgi:hypothetical protein